MNTNVKLLIGAVVGGGIGWFVGSVVVEIIAAKNDPFANEHYHDSDEFPQGEDIEIEEQTVMYKKEDRPRRVKNYSDLFKNPELAPLVEKYNMKVAPATDEIQGMTPDHMIEDEFDMPEDEKEEDISIISAEDYANAEGFSAVTLRYYLDDVVTDEHDNPIDHPEQIIGDDALVSFGVLSEDEDVVYVSNLPKKAMYEIIRLDKEYTVPNPAKAKRLAMKEKMRRDRIDSMGEEEHYGEGNP